MTNKAILVVKRSGEKEPLDYDKINKVLIWATDDINGVSASDIAMASELEFFNGITTEEIHEVLIKTTANMITEDTPNYQYVAAKLKNYLLRKKVFNTYDKFPRLKDLIKRNVDRGVYDSVLLETYDEYEMDKIENYIKHQRDEELTYAGISQLMDKYLLIDRTTGEHFETPQFMYILIPMTIFATVKDKKRRRKLIKSTYDYISTHVISLPTPILGGVRTPNRQYSSCTLIDCDDTLNSIDASETAVSKYISKRAGIGLNSRIRGIGAKVKNGEVEHTGIIPFIKRFEASVKSCSQGGIRGGAATIYYPFWHYEVEDLLVLKNNAGNELNRARRMDHAFQFSRIFYKRFLNNEDITLFSPDEVPDLYEAFGFNNDKFDTLYEKYERSRKIRKKKINARDYMNLLVKERVETGRIYIMNIDNANEHSSFTDKISMSNLCVEIDLCTSPLQHIDDGKNLQRFIAVPEDKLAEYQEYKNSNFGLYFKNSDDENYKFLYKAPKGIKIYHPLEMKYVATKGVDGIYRDNENRLIFDETIEVVYGDKPAEIALCVLSALNLGNINSLDELEEISYITLSILDYVIEMQDYPINAAEKMLKRRSVGVGVTNFAYWLVKNGLSYTSSDALDKVDELFEHIQFYLIKASVELAKEYGSAEWFKRTKYGQGLLPIDHYNKNVDQLTSRERTLDWEWLRKEVAEYGMRNSTLTALMPCESSSVVSSSTNGIEPIRSLITNKKSKSGSPLPVVVPEIHKYKNKYHFAYSFDNSNMNKIVSIMQKWIDQGISTNHYYDMNQYEDNSLPTSVVVKDILDFYKFGGKQIYYANTKDNNKEGDTEEALASADIGDVDDFCEGGACAV